jgi:NAD(P)-dependent dehydrogenase (short-subunit alcohol dehydrogenase family)
MGVLQDKVVLITGGGNGIGMECAKLAAKEGAAVVVNDFGSGPRGGAEGDATPAENVARAIRDAGGRAIAHAGSVTDYGAVEDMVQQALKAFGGLHVVMNPAGFLRDGMFHKMERPDWTEVVDVHLQGAFNVAHATVNHFRDQGEGAYVLFTSTSGVIGAMGQANYATAKMGVCGLSRSLAIEGAKKGIHSNVIAPFAWSRLVATIPVKDEASALRVERVRTKLRAEQIAPLAVALAAKPEFCSGQILGARGNEVFLFNQPRPIKTAINLSGWTVESLAESAFPAMQSALTPLETSPDLFNWEPV